MVPCKHPEVFFLSKIRPCPKCGSEEVLRAHRKTGWERLASVFGFYPYTCRGCRLHFLRHRKGAGFVFLAAAVWLVSAALLGGAAWWLLRDGQAVRAPASPARVKGQARPGDASQQQMRASLRELRQAVVALSQEKASLQQALTQMSRQIAASASPPATPDPRLAQLEARNRQPSRELEARRRSPAASQAAAPKPPAAPAKPADASPGLLATIAFGPGRTQLGPRARAVLQKAAENLGRVSDGEILVEGKADATPLGKATAKLYYDNAGLALARSLSVFRALRDLGVDPERMRVSASGAPAKEPGAGRTVKVWLLKRPGETG